jgi:hypothetical protein
MRKKSAIAFPFTEHEFNDRLQQAVEFYWSARLGQASRQQRRGRSDAGTRGEVTGGKQLDAFGVLLEDLAKAAGYRDDEIFFRTALPVPGYYRPQKRWDFAVCREGRLIAAAEFKSQSGSFGNNFNNRTEEVLGLARDFWVAYREKVFGLVPQPWLGYLFLLEESGESERPVGLYQSPLAPLGKFAGTSYQDRYRILCETLLLERDFTAASLLVSHRPEPREPVAYAEPHSALSVLAFCRSLFVHLYAAAHG